MNKRQIVSIALCFVCAAIIGICCMAGISKWRAYQAEVKRQQQLAQYTEDLTDALNELYHMETDLFQDIAKQQASGIDNRTILQSMLDAATAPIDALARVQAPDELAKTVMPALTSSKADTASGSMSMSASRRSASVTEGSPSMSLSVSAMV